MLDYVPARLRVLRIRRPKYGCRTCGTIHQAPARPSGRLPKGSPAQACWIMCWLASIATTCPLPPVADLRPPGGVAQSLDPANWVGGASWWLEALRERLAAHIFASGKLFADDTPVQVLDPGRGRTRIGRLWVYVRDDRPWAGPDPPAAVYFYSPDRKAERPAAHLNRFRGVLQGLPPRRRGSDGYAGFETLAAGAIVLAACWAHTRRKFYEVHQATGSPIAAEALRRIAALYVLEAGIRGRSAAERRQQSPQNRPCAENDTYESG